MPSSFVQQKLLENLEEASNELLITDEQAVPYVLGECFVRLPNDSAEERLAGESKTAAADAERLEGELAKIKSEMEGLKKARCDERAYDEKSHLARFAFFSCCTASSGHLLTWRMISICVGAGPKASQLLASCRIFLRFCSQPAAIDDGVCVCTDIAVKQTANQLALDPASASFRASDPRLRLAPSLPILPRPSIPPHDLWLTPPTSYRPHYA